MITICCSCKDCQGRGVSVPAVLQALTATVEGRHGIVWNAHDPFALGVVVRRQTGITAVAGAL